MLEHLSQLPPVRIERALIDMDQAPRPIVLLGTASAEIVYRDERREQPRLTGISLRNFKGIDELRLNFDARVSPSTDAVPAAMLLGENSTGKSSVLQAIAMILMNPTEIYKLRLDPDDFISRHTGAWQFSHEMPLAATLHFANGASSELSYSAERKRFDVHPRMQGIVLAYGARRYFCSQRQGVPNESLFDPMAVLSDPSTWLQNLNEDDFHAIARAMREILALGRAGKIFRDKDGVVQVEVHGRKSPIARMSEGYRSLFGMACDIMRSLVAVWGNLEFARGVVLIDEIETHLHPRWKMRVMSALRAAMPQVQFIATTHDPLCLRGMRDGEVHVLYLDNMGRVTLRKGLPNIEALRVEQILTSDYFGLDSTSDPEQEKILAELAELAAFHEEALTDAQRKRRDTLLENYGGIPPIRESRDRQVLTEAITRHLREHPSTDLVRQDDMLEDAIADIKSVLKRSLLR